MRKKTGKLKKRICAVGMAIAAAGITGPTVISALPADSVFAVGDVAINDTNFPDDNFRKYVSEKIDKNGDAKLSNAEINDIESIDCSDCNIQNLKGIEYFYNLKELNCCSNELSNLDVSNNTNLTHLHCAENNLSSLNVCNNSSLEYLRCSNNKLTDLDVSDNSNIRILVCDSNKIKKLDLTKNKKLEEIYFQDNESLNVYILKDQTIDVCWVGTNWECKNEDNQIVSIGDINAIALDAYSVKLKGLNDGKSTVNAIFTDFWGEGKNNKTYIFNVIVGNGKASNKNGWYNEGGFKYYKNDTFYTGWHYMTHAEGENIPHWSYFGDDGRLRTGWVQLGIGTSNPDGNSAKHWSYFGDNGWLRTGWLQLGKGTSEPDGNNTKHWSYFGDNGWLRLGLQDIGKGTTNPDGNNPRHKSYFGDNGWLVTNSIFSVSGKTYTADDRGWTK